MFLNNKTIKTLDIYKYWEAFNIPFEYIYIIPTNRKMNWYRLAAYVWEINWVKKIIDYYDWWSFIDYIWWEVKGTPINFDFECSWIKIWSNQWKLRYNYWWAITLY